MTSARQLQTPRRKVRSCSSQMELTNVGTEIPQETTAPSCGVVTPILFSTEIQDKLCTEEFHCLQGSCPQKCFIHRYDLGHEEEYCQFPAFDEQRSVTGPDDSLTNIRELSDEYERELVSSLDDSIPTGDNLVNTKRNSEFIDNSDLEVQDHISHSLDLAKQLTKYIRQSSFDSDASEDLFASMQRMHDLLRKEQVGCTQNHNEREGNSGTLTCTPGYRHKGRTGCSLLRWMERNEALLEDISIITSMVEEEGEISYGTGVYHERRLTNIVQRSLTACMRLLGERDRLVKVTMGLLERKRRDIKLMKRAHIDKEEQIRKAF